MNRCFSNAFLIASVCVTWATAAPALAIDRHWNALSGTWGIAANWSPSGLPGPSDVAYVDFFNGAPGLAVVGSNVGSPAFIQIANGGTVSVSVEGVLGCGGFFNVGANSTGGTLRVIGSELSPFPGRLTVGDDLRLGVNSGFGSVAQSAGTVSVADTLFIGHSNDPTSAFNAVGTYSLTGGILNAMAIRVASPGGVSSLRPISGRLNVGSGIATTASLEMAASAPAAVASANQTGGRLNVTGSTVMYHSSTYTQSGGSFASAQTTLTDAAAINYSGGTMSLGSLTLFSDSRVVMSAAGAERLLRTRSVFAQSPGVFIDLGDNAMIVESPDINTFLQVSRGYNAGAWNGGAGIRSSSAAAVAASGGSPRTALGTAYGVEAAVPTIAGQVIPPGAQLTRYTLYGDADLDLAVDIADFSRVASNFNRTDRRWSTGDFDYNGSTGLSDFALLASNFNRVLSADAALGGGVPEPSAPAVLLVAVVVAVSARQRGQHGMEEACA